MSAQPEHTRPGGFPYPLTLAEFYEPAAWCSFSCTIESRCYAAGEIIVLWVEGEVDLCTLPTLQAALDEGLDQYPAYFLVDLGRVTFCSVRGLDLLTQTGRTATENAIGYAVTGVLPQTAASGPSAGMVTASRFATPAPQQPSPRSGPPGPNAR